MSVDSGCPNELERLGATEITMFLFPRVAGLADAHNFGLRDFCCRPTLRPGIGRKVATKQLQWSCYYRAEGTSR